MEFCSSGNRTRTCVRRGGYEPDRLDFVIKKAPDFSEAFVLVALTGQFSNHFVDDLNKINIKQY
jgi:hypothetical protein